MARTSREPAPETPDPVAALESRDIHERAAAARDLSRFGEPRHLPLLVERAQSDRSPAVRLGCAAAASDILSRYRLPPQSERLSLDERRELVQIFRGFDPVVNSGLFPILACLGLPDLFSRIAAGLRDPRGDVRVGGAVGLLRMVQSAAVAGDELMEQRVVSLLSDKRLKPDALAAVAQICAAVGYRTALPHLLHLDLTGAHGEAVAKALETFKHLDAPLRGLWFSDGRDAGEVHPGAPQGEAFLILPDTGPALVRDDDGQWHSVPDFRDAPVRRMYFRRVGEPEPGPAFQRELRTWYMAGTNRLKALLEEDTAAAHSLALDWAAVARGEGDRTLSAVADQIEPFLDDTAALWRDLGLLRARAGDLPGAIRTLRAALEAKRTPADVWFHLGEALAASGQPAEARQLWAACLEHARSKKAPYVKAAQDRLTPQA